MSDELEPISFDDEDSAIDFDDSAESSGREIRRFDRGQHAEHQWKRTPVVTGQGVCRLKSFHAKLRDDAMEYMDDQVNEWLDDNPGVEVKFVTTTIGDLKGKIVEPALFINLWY